MRALRASWILAFVASCGGGAPDTNGDAGIEADGGVRSLCPIPENAPRCGEVSACEGAAFSPPPSNCEACRPSSGSLCVSGRCETPPLLEVGDIQNVRFTVDPTLRSEVKGFAQFAVASETSGGQRTGCADVYAGRVNLANGCFNILESRGRDISSPADTYTLSFSRFASGQRVLFLIYGFATEGAAGQAVGVSCTEHETPAPGSGRVDVPGDMMRRIN